VFFQPGTGFAEVCQGCSKGSVERVDAEAQGSDQQYVEDGPSRADGGLQRVGEVDEAASAEGRQLLFGEEAASFLRVHARGRITARLAEGEAAPTDGAGEAGSDGDQDDRQQADDPPVARHLLEGKRDLSHPG